MDDWRELARQREMLCDSKAATDPPEFPYEWTAKQRCAAYWFVVQCHGSFPTHPSGWHAILAQAESQGKRRLQRHHGMIAEARDPSEPIHRSDG